jgi:hypothetical protein
MVHPYGVPNSSLRAYLLPILAPEASTRDATPARRSLPAEGDLNELRCETRHTFGLQISLIRGVNSELALSGTIKHLIGATIGGRDNTYCGTGQDFLIPHQARSLTPRATSLSLAQ